MDKPIRPGLKTIFLFHWIIALVFGLVFFIYPALWTNLAGIKIEGNELYRMLGAAMLALSVSSWLAFRAKMWESVRILVITEIVWTILATIVLLYYIIKWGFPPLYWLSAGLMAFFAIVFTWSYFLYGRKT